MKSLRADEGAGEIRHDALFLSAQLHDAVAERRAEFMPIFFSDIPGLFTSGRIPLAVSVGSAPLRHCGAGVEMTVAPRIGRAGP